MMNFDSPNREQCAVFENRTNSPLQALNLMNDVTFLEAARKLGERMMTEGGATPRGADRLRISRWCWRVRRRRGRPQVLARAFDRFAAEFRGDPKSAAAFLKVGRFARARGPGPRRSWRPTRASPA